jgi:hypothetical protein
MKAVLLWLLGLLWAARSLQSFTDPDFRSPGSAADWFAVGSLSLALLLLPVGGWILLERSTIGLGAARLLSLAVGLAADTAAVANLVEDGFGVSGAGSVYFAGVAATLLALLAVAVALATGGSPLLALVPLATVAGMVNLERGGGALVLIAWGWFASTSGRE